MHFTLTFKKCTPLSAWINRIGSTRCSCGKMILIYGIRSSGNLAEWGIRQTAELTKNQYPRNCEVIMNDIYVVDCLFGENKWHEMQATTDHLKITLEKGGF